METTIKQRLIQFVEYKGMSIRAFERQCGMSNGYIRSIEQTIMPKKLKDISLQFPELNKSWLLTGEGEMLINENNSQAKISFTSGVPYYNVDFIGGFDLVLNDQTAKPEYLIDFKKYNEATCWCNVTGHSMEPEITHGDIIALKKIEDISFLPLGEVYAIVTKNGMRTIKRLGPSTDPKCYTLVPTNKSPEYGIQEIPKNMIQQVFQVLGCMKRL